MQEFNFKSKNKEVFLALGAESAGNFSVCLNGKIYFSEDFGDLLEEKNWLAFQKAVLAFIKKNKIIPDIILSDLHPLMKTTLWAKILAKKFKAQHIQIQHHQAHIFSAIGDHLIKNSKFKIQNYSYGISLDGTGYGEDDKIWGGEVFKLKIKNEKLKIIERIGHLENQIMIGGELATREPARMLISILAKISGKNHRSSVISQKKFIYNFVKKYYNKNEFELLHNQLKQNFNCIETSSAGRILDAVSLLLGFCKNERKHKHAPIDLLEKNSTIPYKNLTPKIIEIKNKNNLIENSSLKIDSKFEILNSKFILNTTYLFEYLINNLHKDKKRLAATAQLYIAQGLYEIIKKSSVISHQSFDKNKPSTPCHPELDSGSPTIFASGGIANNKIISKYFASKNIFLNKKTRPVIYGVPRGDAGLSFGQIFWFLFKK